MTVNVPVIFHTNETLYIYLYVFSTEFIDRDEYVRVFLLVYLPAAENGIITHDIVT